MHEVNTLVNRLDKREQILETAINHLEPRVPVRKVPLEQKLRKAVRELNVPPDVPE